MAANRIRISAIALIAVSLSVLGGQQTTKGTLEGFVRRIDTSEPIADVQVTDLRDRSTAVFTDANGHFTMTGVPPGQIPMRAQKNGFGPRRPDVNFFDNQTITLKAGDHLQGITFGLVPWGAITGVVHGRNGAPAVGATVTAGAVNYRDGKRTANFSTAFAQGLTNDRGEYRLFYLGPGEYFVRVDPPGTVGARGFRGAGNRGNNPLPPEVSETEVRTYFPSVYSFAEAKPVYLREGEDIRADIAIRTDRTETVSGWIVPPAAMGSEITLSQIVVEPAESEYPHVDYLSFSIRGTIGGQTPARIPFSIQGIRPGRYNLLPNILVQSPRSNYIVQIPFQVGSGDVQGMELLIPPPVEIKGRFVGSDGSVLPGNDSIPIQIHSEKTGFSFSNVVMRNNSGVFTIPNLSSGSYRIDGIGLPGDMYLADIRQGSKSILRSGSVEAGSSDIVDFVLNSGTGIVEGTVADIGLDWQNTVVVLIPENALRENNMMYKVADPDSKGRFTLYEVAPGDYKLFAWFGIPSRVYQNVEFLSKYETQGIAVHVTSDGKSSVPLIVIRPQEGTR